MDREMIDLYSDYLITNFGQATATGLSSVLNEEISHDSITRFLSDRELTSKDYWQLVKPVIRSIQEANACISIDDIWYGSAANMRLVKLDLGKEFITPLKENRKIKLVEGVENPVTAVSKLELEEGKPYLVQLESVPFDVLILKLVFLLTRQHLAGCSRFKHEDGGQGVQFLCSSATGCSGEEIRLAYRHRWPVEEQHKSGKQNAGLGSSPASLVVARVNHVFCSFVGVLKLECLKLSTGLNHFLLRSKLRLRAVQAALLELNRLRGVHLTLAINPV